MNKRSVDLTNAKKKDILKQAAKDQLKGRKSNLHKISTIETP